MIKKFAILVFLFCLLSGPVAFSLEISGVLQGDFDPWNETRWAAWYSNGKVVETFDIDVSSLTFASKGTDWTPDLSNLSSGILFSIVNHQGIDIDAWYWTENSDQYCSGGESIKEIFM